MNKDQEKPWLLNWFPERRFAPDFPLVLWFVGLWFLLKSFVCLCHIYSIGLEPPPYSTEMKIELWYFAFACVVSLVLGLALWNEKKAATIPALFFLIVDSPMLLFHIMYLTSIGYLDSGIQMVLEYGSLALNMISLGWLIGHLTSRTIRQA
jgi:hypothetical protein